MKTKEELLKHYATKIPRHLKQYDIFTDPETWDSVVTPNSVWMTETDELMGTPWTVRVLVDPRLSDKEAVKALNNIKLLVKSSDKLNKTAEILTKKLKLNIKQNS
jgi:hypothetical protein